MFIGDFGMEIIELGIGSTYIKGTLNKLGELPTFYAKPRLI